MSVKTVLYTPGTGLPDFEMRIALGLCAAALNALDPEKVTLLKHFNKYVITIDHEGDNTRHVLEKALGWLCLNRLSNQSFLLRIPGFRPRHLDKQAMKIAEFGKKLCDTEADFISIFSEKSVEREGAHAVACGHDYPKDSKVTDALLSFSPHLGQPPKRNNVTHCTTLPLCPHCVAAGLAGVASFQVDVAISSSDRSKKEKLSFLPHFQGEITGSQLTRYLAATKHISGSLEDIPASGSLIVLLSLHPHLLDILRDSTTSFFVGRLDSGGNAPRYGHYIEQSIRVEALFLKNVYNRALVQDCYLSDDRSKLLSFLTRSLHNHDEKAAIDFARTYVGVKKGKALLPKPTTQFFLEEGFKMELSLLEGENFEVARKIADMLQYFVRERNFGYVDNLRKARNADEFAKLLLDAQREAQSVALDSKKQFKPFLPGQSVIQHLLRLINESEKQFRSIQTLIALLAFTYYKKES